MSRPKRGRSRQIQCVSMPLTRLSFHLIHVSFFVDSPLARQDSPEPATNFIQCHSAHQGGCRRQKRVCKLPPHSLCGCCSIATRMAFGTGRTLVMGGHSQQKQRPRQIQPLEQRQRNGNFRQCRSLLIDSQANVSKHYPVRFLMNLVDVLPQLLRIPKPCFCLEELIPLGTQLQRSTVKVGSTDLCFGSTAQDHFRTGVGKLEG